MSLGPKKSHELAERISAAAQDLKRSDGLGSRFIMPWRIYPSQEHPRRQTEELASCSSGECGCGISPDVK
jgi:hypothetical protein